MDSFILQHEDATHTLAAKLAARCGVIDCVTLSGDLGTGKTSFCRAFIQALAQSPVEVVSPTFTLVQPYDLPGGPLWHFDLYRLKRADEARELGLDEALAGGQVLIEWPELVTNLLPRNRLEITIAYGETPQARVFNFKPFGHWANLLEELTD